MSAKRNFTYATLYAGTSAEMRVRRCVICGQPAWHKPGSPPSGGCPWESSHTPAQIKAREYTGPAA